MKSAPSGSQVRSLLILFALLAQLAEHSAYTHFKKEITTMIPFIE